MVVDVNIINNITLIFLLFCTIFLCKFFAPTTATHLWEWIFVQGQGNVVEAVLAVQTSGVNAAIDENTTHRHRFGLLLAGIASIEKETTVFAVPFAVRGTRLVLRALVEVTGIAPVYQRKTT